MPAEPEPQLTAEFGWTLTQMYGLTETAPFITVCEPRPEHDTLSAEARATIKARQGVELITSGELTVVGRNKALATRAVWECIFNGGKLQNLGQEVAVSISPFRRPDLNWIARVTFSRNRSKVVELPVPAFNTGGFGTSLGAFRIEQGKSATQIVGMGMALGIGYAGFDVLTPEGTYFVTADVTALGGTDGMEFCRSLPERCRV